MNKNKNSNISQSKDQVLLEENNFIDLEAKGILPNEQLNIDLIPLNILKREQFIDLLKSIIGNKLLLI